MRAIETEKFDETFEQFIDQQKPNTRNGYTTCLRYWIQFSGMNGKATLDLKRNDKDALTEKKVLAFKKWMMEKKDKSEAYARVASACLRGFYTSNRMPLVFTRSEKKGLNEGERATQDYLFAKEDLGKMSEQASLTERYVLLVGKSIGLRAGDFVKLTYGTFRSLHLDSDAPISLGEVTTEKERVPAFPFLDSDAVQVVKAVLERNPDAKDGDRVLDWNEESLSHSLQNLFKKAHLVNGQKRVRFHNLRKYLIDRLSAVTSESQWKQIVGKKISEGAYVSTDQLRDVYLRAMPSITINGNGKNHVQIEELKNALAQAEDERKATQTRLEQALQRIEELQTKQANMFQKLTTQDQDIAEIKTKLGIKEKFRPDQDGEILSEEEEEPDDDFIYDDEDPDPEDDL